MYLEKPFASYEVAITNTGIRLNSVEYTKIILNDNDEIESTESSAHEAILCIDAHYIPVEEFAQRFPVDVETAINWIEHRMVKCAEKRPSGWCVMETQGLPAEESQSGSYIFIGESGDLSSVAPLCERAQVFSVFQAEKQGGLSYVMSFDSSNRLIEDRQICCEELASLENALIRSQEVLFEDMLIEIIDEKVILGFKENPFAIIEEERLLSFVAQLDLPEETKNILKTMVKDNCGEGLFIEVLAKLSKKEDFIAFVSEATIECGEKHSSMRED